MTVMKDRDKTAGRLLGSSARNSYDPLLDIDWDAPLDGPDGAELAFLPFERVSLYGTELWEQLSPEQRIELSKQELASVASTGLWFEIILIQMLARYAYHQDPQAPHTQYALTEIGDETRHVIMFAKALDRMGTPTYRPQPLRPSTGAGLQGHGAGHDAVRAGPGRRGDHRPAAARDDERRADPPAGADGQPHPRRGGGPARPLRARGGRAPDADAGPGAQVRVQHRRRARVGLRRQRPDQPAGVRAGRPRPEAGRARRARRIRTIGRRGAGWPRRSWRSWPSRAWSAGAPGRSTSSCTCSERASRTK